MTYKYRRFKSSITTSVIVIYECSHVRIVISDTMQYNFTASSKAKPGPMCKKSLKKTKRGILVRSSIAYRSSAISAHEIFCDDTGKYMYLLRINGTYFTIKMCDYLFQNLVYGSLLDIKRAETAATINGS